MARRLSGSTPDAAFAKNRTLLERQDTHLSKAFKDLEFDICDARNLALVAETVLEATLSDAAGMEGPYRKFMLTEEQFDALNFIVNSLGSSVRQIHKSYFEAWETSRNFNRKSVEENSHETR
jgi:hypothetical protein